MKRVGYCAIAPNYYLDITSDICPITFVKTKLLLEKMAPGETVEVRLGEGEPVINVPRSVKAEGHTVLSLDLDPEAPGVHVLIIKKFDPASQG
ncbi:MAG: sulfurtransferase TusA family protein [Alphaproteobacteria bacterium]|nr:sulfurtransferase TusA family protein [Alphaproteobacteria bacterium]MBT4017698.1 sulfurtransferase TusA family protein [Alphaproteobacteria bacterium]MBT5160906.1 sulfurtransferase TusA family protein [Alphaproteobacteria bacterium]MBT5919316.1 sulfurtransferase TusA family protein [Alphaproteobacteria bacterium]MBT6387926.1 sulfurtransferase TusA family protein [Alphaproteobacteria bacterium]